MKKIILLMTISLLLVTGCNKSQNNQATKTIDDEKITKIDESKDWVYDAKYEATTSSSSYTTANNEIKNISDLKVPFININTEPAKFANEDIRIIYDAAVDEFNEGLENKITFAELNYKSNVTDEYVSVIMSFGVGGTDVINPKYYSYNISLKDGNNISFQDAYKIVGIQDSEINNKVEEKIKDYLINELNVKVVDDYQNYIDESINNYHESINNNGIVFYLNENKELEIMVQMSVPAGSGNINSLISIK